MPLGHENSFRQQLRFRQMHFHVLSHGLRYGASLEYLSLTSYIVLRISRSA
jgi:hypothetical protein